MGRLWTKSFVLLTVGMLFLYTAFYSLLPVLPIHLENIGASKGQIGIIIGLFTLSAVICRPFVGQWLDRYGRKFYIYAGIIFFAFFLASYSFISIGWGIFLIRILHGMSWGVANTALGTAITDQIPADKLGQGMGWYGLSMTLAMAFGPLLGSYLLEHYSASMSFTAAAALTLFPLLFIMKVSFVPKTKEYSVAPIRWTSQLCLMLIVIGCLSFSFGGITTYIPLYIGQQTPHVSTFFIVYAVSLSVVRPVAGKWIDRRGERPVIILAMLFVITALLQLSLASGVSGIILSAAIYGMGFGMAQPAMQTYLLRLVSINRAGSANALFFTAFDVGIGTGAIILGICATYWPYPYMFVLSGIVVSLGLVTFVFKKKII